MVSCGIRDPLLHTDQVIFGIALGAFLGFSFCYIMKYSLRKRFIDRESYVAQYIALALMSIGVTSLLGSDDLLAAFAAGKCDIFPTT